jgi:hypothetical protein
MVSPDAQHPPERELANAANSRTPEAYYWPAQASVSNALPGQHASLASRVFRLFRLE